MNKYSVGLHQFLGEYNILLFPAGSVNLLKGGI